MTVDAPPSTRTPMRQENGREIAALLLGLVALGAFALLAPPTDMTLFDLPGELGLIAQPLYPLALGPEILFSPIGVIAAIAAIVVGRPDARMPADTDNRGRGLARAGLLLGWITVALYLVSLGLIFLSFQGVLKPLI
jgi:hypothetical protein